MSLFSSFRPPDGPRRAVVLVGPPKTGSSHLQAFLVSNRANLAAHGWQWPRGVDGQPGGPKSFANLVTALSGRTCSPRMKDNAPTLVDAIASLCHGRSSEIAVARSSPAASLLARYAKEFERVASSSAPNLVLSAEDFALFDGSDATSVGVRRQLRELLSRFEQVEAVVVFRTPRAPAMQSVYTEDLDWGYDGVAEGGRTSLAAWLYSKLDEGTLLRRAPWSSSLNIGRLSDAWNASGFSVRVISSAGARADGLDTTDVLACEILGLPCTRGKAAWSRCVGRADSSMGYESCWLLRLRTGAD